MEDKREDVNPQDESNPEASVSRLNTPTWAEDKIEEVIVWEDKPVRAPSKPEDKLKEDKSPELNAPDRVSEVRT